MIFALDFLALAKYPKIALQEFPFGYGLGAFSNTFGDSREAVDDILQTGKCNFLRIHLMWKDRHNFSRADFPDIVKEAKKWKSIVLGYPSISFNISGACEHLLNRSDAELLCQRVLDVLPEVTYVNTPGNVNGRKGALIFLPNSINEVHSSGAPATDIPHLYSFDGSPVVDSDVEAIKARHKNAKAFFLWEPRFNLRWEDTDTTPRPQRTDPRRKPDAKLIRSVIALAGNSGNTSLPTNWIYKSHAENKGPDPQTGKIDPRAEKPCLISSVKAPTASIKDGDMTLHTLQYYGTFPGNRHRYYGARWGYEIATRPVDLYVGSKKYGVVNPAFRAGQFRN